jgi:hypothetical protein
VGLSTLANILAAIVSAEVVLKTTRITLIVFISHHIAGRLSDLPSATRAGSQMTNMSASGKTASSLLALATVTSTSPRGQAGECMGKTYKVTLHLPRLNVLLVE